MRGSIHSDQRCPLCESRYKDDRATGLYCPNHADQQATTFIVRFGKITKRFTDYREGAQVFLDGLRHEVNHGKFDIRDYRKDEPLGFENLAEKWLKRKKHEIKPGSFRKLKCHIAHASKVFQNQNIKGIGFPELEDFLAPVDESEPLYGLAGKTRHNIRSTLHSFFAWTVEREYLTKAPKFPKITYQMAYRKLLSKDQQRAVIAELKKQTYHKNPKIWLAVLWLSTYINCRPGLSELLSIKHKNIDLEQGRILIENPKEGKSKWIRLIDEDVEILASMPPAFPELYFFRHVRGNGGAKPGQRFGKNYLYNCWKRACKAIGIENVDLYAGTRHSTMVDLRLQGRTPEEIKRGSGHSTNKALDRYLIIDDGEIRALYQAARTDNRLITDLEATGTENANDFKR